jgi:hypothetical protein
MIPTDQRRIAFWHISSSCRGVPWRWAAALTMALALAGCGGEPSLRELENRRELEALLTAVSLRSVPELEKDSKRIDDRRASGQLSEARHKDLRKIIETAREGRWGEAETRAYEYREQTPFFK